MSVEIKKVGSRSELKKFVRFPHTLYKDCKQWVPPLNSGEMDSLTPGKNPAFEYAQADCFLAYKDGKVVGRVAAILNPRANKIWKQENARFGWFEFIDDYEVSGALLKTVENWAKEKGLTGVHGPFGFTDFDGEGMLIEGFENPGTITTIYNYPYYPKHMEYHGYSKVEDWIQYKFLAQQPVPEKIEKLSKVVAERYNLKGPIFTKKKQLKPYVPKLLDLINVAFTNLYGFAPFTEAEKEYYVKNYFTFAQPELICFVTDEHDNLVAFGVSFPSLSKSFRKAKGKLFPFGFIGVLRELKRYKDIDLYFMGVHPDWQKKGVHALLMTELNKSYIRKNVRWAVSNPQLETNVHAVHVWENYSKEKYMRRRCYGKFSL
jgi:GNAT superfamily N-acetyltransferase